MAAKSYLSLLDCVSDNNSTLSNSIYRMVFTDTVLPYFVRDECFMCEKRKKIYNMFNLLSNGFLEIFPYIYEYGSTYCNKCGRDGESERIVDPIGILGYMKTCSKYKDDSKFVCGNCLGDTVEYCIDETISMIEEREMEEEMEKFKEERRQKKMKRCDECGKMCRKVDMEVEKGDELQPAYAICNDCVEKSMED